MPHALTSRPLTPLLLARSSRFAGLAQTPARMLLGGLMLVLVVALAVLPTVPVDGTGDTTLLAAIADGVRSGGDYYTAAADTLRQGAGPAGRALVLRLPTLAMVGAGLPPLAMTAMLWVLAFGTALACYARISPAMARPAARLAALLLLAAGMAAAPLAGAAMVHEAWAGLLIALSLILRRPGRTLESIALGLAATLVCETAALYLIVMVALALRDRAPREAIGWAAALAMFGLVLGFHLHALLRAAPTLEIGAVDWIGTAGIGLAIAVTAPAFLPTASGAVLLILATLGWAAWRDPLALRTGATIIVLLVAVALSAAADATAAALLVAPLSLVGLIFAIEGLRDLASAALDRRRITVTRITR